MAVSKSDLENPTSRSGLRSKVKAQGWLSNHLMTFLFYINRPAITTTWPIRCSTIVINMAGKHFQCIYIYIFTMWDLKGIRFFSGMWESVSLTPVVWWWNWTENKKSPWLAEVTSIISHCLNTENLTWMIHVPNDLSQYWNYCSISFYIRDRLALKSVALCYIFVLNLSIYLE